MIFAMLRAQILLMIRGPKAIKVHQVRPVAVDDGIEGKSISPAPAEVGHVDARYPVDGLFSPLEERLPGLKVLAIDHDIGNLKTNDKRNTFFINMVPI